MIIIMSLASTSNKLQNTWQTLSHKDTHSFSLLHKLIDLDSNMRYYRHKLQSIKKLPILPFLPAVLKDMTFLKENSTWLVSHPHLINFAKCRSIKQCVEKHKRWISKPYPFNLDLVQVPFLTSRTNNRLGTLDPIGQWFEARLNSHCSC